MLWSSTTTPTGVLLLPFTHSRAPSPHVFPPSPGPAPPAQLPQHHPYYQPSSSPHAKANPSSAAAAVIPSSSPHPAAAYHSPPLLQPTSSGERVSPTSCVQPPTGGVVGAPGPAAMVFPAPDPSSGNVAATLGASPRVQSLAAAAAAAAASHQQHHQPFSQQQEGGTGSGASAVTIDGLRIASGATPQGFGSMVS